MTFNLPNVSAEKSAAFDERFKALPAELKAMIIARTVSHPGLLYLRYFENIRKKVCKAFDHDDELLAEAHKQFERVNTFVLPFGDPVVLPLARNIRHLRLYNIIEIEGGDLMDPATHSLSEWDTTTINAVPGMFPQLETLEYYAVNNARITPGATYSWNGSVWPVQDTQWIMTHERMSKMAAIMNCVCELEFLPWRRDLKTKTKVTFVQDPDKSTSRVLNLEGPDVTAANQEALAFLYEIMDEQQAAVFFDPPEGDPKWWW